VPSGLTVSFVHAWVVTPTATATAMACNNDFDTFIFSKLIRFENNFDSKRFNSFFMCVLTIKTVNLKKRLGNYLQKQ
jgi:hypothetical protein